MSFTGRAGFLSAGFAMVTGAVSAGRSLALVEGRAPDCATDLSYPTPCAGEPRHATKSAKRRVRDLVDEKPAEQREPVTGAKGVDLWVVRSGWRRLQGILECRFLRPWVGERESLLGSREVPCRRLRHPPSNDDGNGGNQGNGNGTGLLTSDGRFREGSTQSDPDDPEVVPVCRTYGSCRKLGAAQRTLATAPERFTKCR